MLQINYRDQATRDLATVEGCADERLGPADASALRALISDAEAFFTAAELAEFRGTEDVEGDSLVIKFGVDRTAHFAPLGENWPMKTDGSPDWQRIKRLMLVKVLP